MKVTVAENVNGKIRSWFEFLTGGGGTPSKIRFHQHHCFGSDVL